MSAPLTTLGFQNPELTFVWTGVVQ
jgi:hypothetical protein